MKGINSIKEIIGSKKKAGALIFQGSCLWWRWGELNPRPKAL